MREGAEDCLWEEGVTDIEMTNACAEAMGFSSIERKGDQVRDLSLGGQIIPGIYWPLKDDAQAMTLIKKFGLLIDPDGYGENIKQWNVSMWDEERITWMHQENTDLNRAIVECVAKMRNGRKV